MLTGVEKPRLVIDAGQPNWFLDDSANELMGVENTVPMFIDKENPDLVVSLAYASLPFLKNQQEGQHFGYHTCDRETKLKMLAAYGFE